MRDKLNLSAQTHLYDHLNRSERKLEVRSATEDDDLASRRAYAEAERLIGQHGIEDWGSRLLEVVRQHRRAQGTESRPILFVCHGTGGTVVKSALSQKDRNVTGMTMAVVFFATPHHGSRVLSEPAYVRAVCDELDLKWEMSESLRQEFALRSQDLEALNFRFVKACVGTKIYSYAESLDTDLAVLSSDDAAGVAKTTVRLCITDSKSGKLGTPDTPIQDEEFVQLNTTHTNTPKFRDEDGLYEIFLDEIVRLVASYDDQHRTAYQALNKSIMQSVQVDVHQFYGEEGSMTLLSARPTLEEFLEDGPTVCMRDRMTDADGVEIKAPAVKVTFDEDDVLEMPTTPKVILQQPNGNDRTKTPPLDRTRLLEPQLDTMLSIPTPNPSSMKPQKTNTFKLPGRTDRFKWIRKTRSLPNYLFLTLSQTFHSITPGGSRMC